MAKYISELKFVADQLATTAYYRLSPNVAIAATAEKEAKQLWNQLVEMNRSIEAHIEDHKNNRVSEAKQETVLK